MITLAFRQEKEAVKEFMPCTGGFSRAQFYSTKELRNRVTDYVKVVEVSDDELVKDVYNEFVKGAAEIEFLNDDSWVGEYDELWGNTTVGEVRKEFIEAGSPQSPLDVPDEYTTFNKIYDMDTVCRAPMFAMVYSDEWEAIW